MTKHDFTVKAILALMSNPAMCVGQRLETETVINTALDMADAMQRRQDDFFFSRPESDDEQSIKHLIGEIIDGLKDINETLSNEE